MISRVKVGERTYTERYAKFKITATKERKDGKINILKSAVGTLVHTACRRNIAPGSIKKECKARIFIEKISSSPSKLRKYYQSNMKMSFLRRKYSTRLQKIYQKKVSK